MKKALLAVAIIISLCGIVYGASDWAPAGKNVDVIFSPTKESVTVMNAQSATGDATAYDIGFDARRHACTITTGGTAPTTVTLTWKRSTDGGTTYASIFTHTYTLATATTQWVDHYYTGRRWKVSYDSKTGGTGDTTVTVKCDFKE